ncbi:hypothetical protein CR513_33306, partial [Mucuna pruriens]
MDSEGNTVCDHCRKSLQVCRIIPVENIATTLNQKHNSTSEKYNFGRNFDLVAPSVLPKPRDCGKDMKEQHTRYCFKGTSQLGIDLSTTTR